MIYQIHKDKQIAAREYSLLMESVGWGSDYSDQLVSRSIAAYPFVAHARSETAALLGYVSAFSDRAFSTLIGELVVHPEVGKEGIGRALLTAVEQEFPGVPVYVKPFDTALGFFLACGYRAPAREMRVLFKRNDASHPSS